MLHASLSHSSTSQGASQVQEVEGMVQDLALQVGEPKQKVQYHKQLKAPVNGRYNLETNYRINYNKTSSYIYVIWLRREETDLFIRLRREKNEYMEETLSKYFHFK